MTTKTKNKNVSSYTRQQWRIKELETRNYQLKMALADEVEKSEIIEKANETLYKKIQELREYEHAQRKLNTLCEMMKEITPHTISLEPVSKLNEVLKKLHNALIENKKLREKAEDLDKIAEILQNDSRLENIPLSHTPVISDHLLLFVECFYEMDNRNEHLENKLSAFNKLVTELDQKKSEAKELSASSEQLKHIIVILNDIILKAIRK